MIGTATSDFGSTNITIVISVSDINDPPVFTKSLYTGSVSEFSARGYRIVQVSATDPDSGGYGEVMYLSNGKKTERRCLEIYILDTCLT